jgi:hypothetical protein
VASFNPLHAGWGEMHPVPSHLGARADEVPVGGGGDEGRPG